VTDDPDPGPLPPTRRERWSALTGAFALAGGTLGILWAREGPAIALQAAGYLAASAVGLGKLIIFAALHAGCDLSAWTLGLLATVAEIGLSAILVYHLDVLFRVPRLGPRLERVRSRSAEMVAANPRLRRLAGIGVAIYTALPFSGTGPLGSSFFGQMAGLTRRATLLGIACGSVASSLLMAWGAVALADRMETIIRHPAMTVAGVALTLGLLGVLGRAVRKRE